MQVRIGACADDAALAGTGAGGQTSPTGAGGKLPMRSSFDVWGITIAASNDSPEFLDGGGEMGERIRAFDWTATPLGRPDAWPQALKTLVGLLLASNQPMFLAWGPGRTWLYNDAFTPILGLKHPAALGRPSMEVWAEAREVLEPMFDRVFAGEPVSIEDFALDLDRRGRIEEAHFEFAYTPARGADGSVEGLFGACIETTVRVVAERRQAEDMKRQGRLFRCAPGFIAILRGPEHTFEFVNEAYVRLLGEREFIGRPVREVVPEVEDQGFFERLDQVYSTGERFIAAQTPISLART
ncbi:MAG TPA: PAS domain-containing protein, partial [Caulobacteraceae bacterium]|nr:PAS domain-containing protein [Caulobacteraceae bacterium]